MSISERSRQLWRSQTLRAVAALASGNLLGMGIGAVGTLVQARFVDPSDMGYFRGFGIVTGYAFVLQLGTIDALQRLYPFLLGKGESDRALELAGICRSWNVGVSTIVSGMFGILALVAFVEGNWRAMLGWLSQAVAMIGLFYGFYLGATYRSRNDFNSVAKGSVLSGIIGGLTLPFFLLWPYVALALRSCVGSLANITYLHVRRPLRPPRRFSFRQWFDLVKTGVPLFTASYGGATLWSVVETTIILQYLGNYSLGLWSMSFMMLEAANKVPQAVTAIYFPRVMENFGRGGGLDAAIRLCKTPVVWFGLAMIIMAACCCVGLSTIMPILMPRYSEAVPTACLMMLILPLIILEIPYSFLVAQGQVVQQNVIIYGGLCCFVLLALLSIKMGLGLNGVVAASLVGRVARLGSIYGYVYLKLGCTQ